MTDATRQAYIELPDEEPFFATIHGKIVENGKTMYLFTKKDGTEGRSIGHWVNILTPNGIDIDWSWEPPDV